MKIQVISPEIGSEDERMSHDYWVRKATNEAIAALGHEVLEPRTTEMPDIQLTFLGMHPFHRIRKKGRYTAGWIYSRPERLKSRKLRGYNQIYTLSIVHQKRLAETKGIESKVLLVSSDKAYKSSNGQYEYDVACMASHRKGRIKPILALADAGLKVVIAGYKWKKEIQHPNVDIIADFWPNEEFSDFFNKAPLSIYVMDKPATINGIVPIRILDVYTSSDCMCLVSDNPALPEMFPELPPTYSSLDELVERARFFLANPEERKVKQSRVRQQLKRTYKDLVNDVIRNAKAFWNK